MNEITQNNKRKRLLCILLLTGSFLAAMKCIFIGYQMDEGYAITLSYRMLLGDKMITHIWDPHQTSAFFSAFLIWIYRALFHTTAGVAIWLRVCGTLIHLALSFGVYKVLCRFLSPEYSFYLGILYFNLLPKGYVTPEFSNLLIWFLTLLLLDLFRLNNKKNPLIAIRCGFWMCGMVLSYPSAAILFPFFLWYLWRQREYGKRSAGLFAGTCLVSGILYVLHLFTYMTFTELLDNLNYMMIGNSGHTEVSLADRLFSYGKQCGQALLILAGCGVIVWLFIVIRKLSAKNNKYQTAQTNSHPTSQDDLMVDKKGRHLLFLYFTVTAGIAFSVLYPLLVPKDNNYFFIYAVYFLLLIAAFFLNRKTTGESYPVIRLWLLSSALTFAAVLMLTDLTIFTTVRYLLPGIIMGLAAFLIYAKQHSPVVYQKYARLLLLAWCFSSIFIKGWEYRGDQDLPQNVTRVRGIISEGPAKGILAEYMQCVMHESLYAEMQQYIEPGSRLLLIENDTTGYLFQDVEVASYTTISDPRYNDILLKYWELNPEKYPDVIAIPCWYGELTWYTDNWETQWTVNEYGASQIIDGTYYRYYIR